MSDGEGRFTSWDGVELYRRWSTPDRPRGTVVVVHGVSEHSGRYPRLAAELVRHGFSFQSFDHRGHGRSPGPRVDVRHFRHYVQDVGAFLDHLAAEGAAEPCFLLGHSMGALVVAEHAATSGRALRGLILSATPLRTPLRPNRIVRWIAHVLRPLLPRLRLVSGITPAELTSDPKIARWTREDPLMHHRATIRWGLEFLAASDRQLELARRIELPVLLVHGEADRVALADGARALFRALASSDKRLAVFPGLRHELHNEAQPGRGQALGLLLDWLEARA